MTMQETLTQSAATLADFRLPDIPEKSPNDMTSSHQLAKGGTQGRLESWLGHPETTIVSGERYICAAPGAAIRYPDLLVAFDARPDLYEANNGYIISLQGKPPDVVLEVASPATGSVDVTHKRGDYAALGIPEYWRFDETGKHHGARLAGDRLADGAYTPIAIDELPGGELRGFSPTLGLYICWRQGRIDWYDPQTGDYIPSLESEKARADAAEEALRMEQARVRELEARLQGESGTP